MRSDYGAIALSFLLLLLPEISTAGPHSERPPPAPDQPPYLHANLTTGLTVVIFVVAPAMFCVALFYIYIRCCGGGGARRAGSIHAVVDAFSGWSRRPRGLDEHALAALPTFAYTEVKGLTIGKGALECAVCLCNFEDDHETLRLLPRCDHVFHADCVDAWFESHTTCPVCRDDLAAADAALGPDSSAVIEINNLQRRNYAAMVPVLPLDMERDCSNRTRRSWSIRKLGSHSSFPRSHTTGHSLAPPGENCDRFTLRLPEDVRTKLVNRSVNRAAGLAMLPVEASQRREYRTGAEGSSRGALSYHRLVGRQERAVKSDRWAFSAAPPFFSKPPKLTPGGDEIPNSTASPPI